MFFLPVLTYCWPSEIETISGGVWDHYREDPVPCCKLGMWEGNPKCSTNEANVALSGGVVAERA